jgi:O-6-methylguanine DNA methyltransferase
MDMNSYVIFFYISSLRCFILIEFKIYGTKEEFSIHLLQFFKNEQQIQSYIKKKSFKLIDEIDLNESERETLQKVLNLIKNYFSGTKLNLYKELQALNIKLDIKDKFNTPFSNKVISWLIKNVKYGETTSYYEIGENVNSKAYRAIGNILKRNPLPLIIPCHRVLKKNGKIGGFMGQSGKNWSVELKRQLLTIEGIEI